MSRRDVSADSVEVIATTGVNDQTREIAVLQRPGKHPVVQIRVGNWATFIFADQFEPVLLARELSSMLPCQSEVYTTRPVGKARQLVVAAGHRSVRLYLCADPHWIRRGVYRGDELDALARAIRRAQQLMAEAA
jgi:hypothetical protein